MGFTYNQLRALTGRIRILIDLFHAAPGDMAQWSASAHEAIEKAEAIENDPEADDVRDDFRGAITENLDVGDRRALSQMIRGLRELREAKEELQECVGTGICKQPGQGEGGCPK